MDFDIEQETILLKAKIFIEANDYSKSCELIESYIKNLERDLTIDERNTFTISFHNLINEKIDKWRKLNKIINKEQLRESDEDLIVNDLSVKRILENEIKNICERVITIIDKYLLIKRDTYESEIIYLKTKGDYYRIQYSILDHNKIELKLDAKNCYKKAYELSKKLSDTNTYKLSFILCYGIFYYEFLNEPTTSINLVKSTYNDAITKIDSLNDRMYKESTRILKLMKKNMELWQREVNAE